MCALCSVYGRPSRIQRKSRSIPAGRLRERMRQRRPHLFSDTIRSSEPAVTREVLDYHLDTLTKRKQGAIRFETK